MLPCQTSFMGFSIMSAKTAADLLLAEGYLRRGDLKTALTYCHPEYLSGEKFIECGERALSGKSPDYITAFHSFSAAKSTERLIQLGDLLLEKESDQLSLAVQCFCAVNDRPKLIAIGQRCMEDKYFHIAFDAFAAASDWLKLVELGDRCLDQKNNSIALRAYTAANSPSKLIALGDRLRTLLTQADTPNSQRWELYESAKEAYVKANARGSLVAFGDSYLDLAGREGSPEQVEASGNLDNGLQLYKEAQQPISEKTAQVLLDRYIKVYGKKATSAEENVRYSAKQSLKRLAGEIAAAATLKPPAESNAPVRLQA